MTNPPLEMSFDPKTIKHLGVKMYSTLPPALAEMISNSYDADAEKVGIFLYEKAGKPSEIKIWDDGCGLSRTEINDKFLIIGRNRREEDGDIPSPKHGRLPTGKKGLGKLALFGLARTITIHTIKDGLINEFVLDWSDVQQAKGVYNPKITIENKKTTSGSGTVITLSNLKRKAPFNTDKLADSLAKIFIVDDNFQIRLLSPSNETIILDNHRKYAKLTTEFTWDLSDLSLITESAHWKDKLSGRMMTTEKPIPPSSGLRGISLYSRGKLVNAPEYFRDSTSSHFYQYFTGWITVDFIDLLDEDVISTNRQSLVWEHPEMAKLYDFLSELVAKTNLDWRAKRKKKKEEELVEQTGIDTAEWISTLPESMKGDTKNIVETLSEDEALDNITPIIKSLHNMIPEYPLLHWRHLHDDIKSRVQQYYENEQFGIAAEQGTRIYAEVLRTMTGRTEDGRALVNGLFGSKPFKNPPTVQITDLSNESMENIQEGQGHFSRGLMTGFRNPITHDPTDSTVPFTFSELDCLNILSLVSYLLTRLDSATINP